jgi:hypothetical protein
MGSNEFVQVFHGIKLVLLGFDLEYRKDNHWI